VQLPVTIRIHRSHLLARLLCRGNVVALMLGSDGLLGIERRDGSHDEATVDSRTTIFTALVVLRFRVGSRGESLVLPRSSLGTDVHRQLRVWLRWRASAAV
jgi:hypothetical protein